MENCTIPGCNRPTMKQEGKGYADGHCRYHVQFKARHGSHIHPSYRAADLKPYSAAAARWIAAHEGDHYVAVTLSKLEALLNNGGEAIPAHRLKGLPPKDRARIAFSRLREARIAPVRLLAIHLGVYALIEDDRGSHRIPDFRRVQVAKALHRLASGSHAPWMTIANGKAHWVTRHDYPKSSGLVLRHMGEAMATASEFITDKAVPEVVALKQELYGLHVSHAPGWTAPWFQPPATRKPVEAPPVAQPFWDEAAEQRKLMDELMRLHLYGEE